MYSPVMPNSRNRKLLSDIEKVVKHYPHMKEFAVSDAHYDILLNSIAVHRRNDYAHSIPFETCTIVRMKKNIK